MDVNNQNIQDILDMGLWKKMQDILFETAGYPISTVDSSGNEVLLSGEVPFFCQLLNSTEKGKEICSNCRKTPVKELQNQKDKVLLSYCEAGLLNIWSSIFIQDKPIGVIGCVSLIQEVKDSVNVNLIAKKTDIESDELTEALDKMKITTQDNVKIISSMLHILAKTMPNIAQQKHESDKKISKLTTLHEVSEMINSTLDIEKIIRYIVPLMIDYTKAEYCSIVTVRDGKVDKKYSSKPFSELDEVDTILTHEIINKKDILKIENIGDDFRFKNESFPAGFNSVVSIPLKVRGLVVGSINLYYQDNGLENLSNGYIDFISIISDQAAMAIFNAQEFTKTKKDSVKDKLTDLYNRRYFMDLLEDEITKSSNLKEPLTVAMIDIDDFKNYNDRLGHLDGDNLIQEISKILKATVRPLDVVGRYGGEEFIIIFPETSNEKAFEILDIISKTIMQKEFKGQDIQPNGNVTISSGLISCMDKTLTRNDIIDLADKSLYKAKRDGKNRIVSKVIVDKNLPILDIDEVNGYKKNHESLE